jgi:hypothetical protein
VNALVAGVIGGVLVVGFIAFLVLEAQYTPPTDWFDRDDDEWL